MKSIAVLITSSPTSSNARRAFALADLLGRQGHRISICLLQDGVLGALARGSPTGEELANLGDIYVLGEDLALRGFNEGDLIPPARLADYGELIGLMMERCDSVIGAF